jgi:hypothetical protein
MDDFASFYQVRHQVKVRRGREDQLQWASSKRGLFEVNSLYYFLAYSTSIHFPWEECLVYSEAFKGGFLCMVGSSRQDPHLG